MPKSVKGVKTLPLILLQDEYHLFSLTYKPTVLDGGHVLCVLHEHFCHKATKARRREKKTRSKIVVEIAIKYIELFFLSTVTLIESESLKGFNVNSTHMGDKKINPEGVECVQHQKQRQTLNKSTPERLFR